MEKLSKKAEKTIVEMRNTGWIEAEYFPGICMVMVKGSVAKTIKKNGTIVEGREVP